MKIAYTVATPETADPGMFAMHGPIDQSFETLGRLGYDRLVVAPGAHAIDGGEHDVGDIWRLECQWPALRSASQRRQERQRGDHADQGRPVPGDVGDAPARWVRIGDRTADPQHGAAAEQRDEIHAVGRVEPFDVAEPMPFTSAT